MEPGDIADLGDEDRRHHRPDPTDCLHRPIADMAPKSPGYRVFDHGELAPVDLEEIAQRGDSDGIRAFEGHLVEELLTSRAEHVVEGWQDAELCHDGVHLGLGRDAEGDELGPVSDEFSQFSKLRRSDPGFGQIAPGESSRELGGIEHVVFHTS